MPTMDQAAWATVNVTTGEGTKPFARGALLPEPGSDEERAERSLLRTIGAVRAVEVVYSDAELAEQVSARARAEAAAAVAHDVDPSLPLGAQVPGGAEPGPPTLTAAHGGPVVIGPEDAKPARARAAAAKPAEGKAGEGKG